LRYELRHPGRAYFPYTPLATLLASGRVYHVDFSVYDREIAGYPLTSHQFAAGLPSGFEVVAIPPGVSRRSSALRRMLERYAPVTDVELLLPAGLSIASSDLGLETCEPAQLEAGGLAGCPPDSLMGRGSAAAEVPFGVTSVTEQAPIELFSGPLQDGHPQLLFFAEGEYPVLADILFGAVVLPAQAPFGGVLNAALPLIPSVTDGPDVALVRLQTTIGAKGITYYERVKGKTIEFHPRGILLPKSCPPGGFAFAARLSFQDATHAGADAVVPCPQGDGGRRWPIPDDRSASSLPRVQSTPRSARP